MFVVPFLLRDSDAMPFLGRVAAGDNPSPGSEIVVLWCPRDSGWVAMAPIRVPLRPSVAAALPPCVAPEDLLALEVLTT